MKLLREKSLCIAISHCFMYCFHTVMACVALVSIKTICVLFAEKYFFVIYWEKINKTTIFHSCEFVILVEIHVTWSSGFKFSILCFTNKKTIWIQTTRWRIQKHILCTYGFHPEIPLLIWLVCSTNLNITL